jgi:hypothetical protein
MRRVLVMLACAAVAVALAPAAASAGGVGGPAFYVDGAVYRTVGTPTDLSGTGAPDDTFDLLYNLGGAQLDVAEAAPGDTDYDGGRWRVHAIGFHTSYAASLAAHDLNGNGVFDSDAEILSALADPGTAGASDLGIVKSFVCPVIRIG